MFSNTSDLLLDHSDNFIFLGMFQIIRDSPTQKLMVVMLTPLNGAKTRSEVFDFSGIQKHSGISHTETDFIDMKILNY